MTTDQSLPGPFNGLRVIELADRTGQWCGKLMADFGADVVKVEPPGGVAERRVGPFYRDIEDPNQSLYFWHYNTSKRSVTLDLEQEAGRELFRRLVSTADVLLETTRPGTMERLGLTYDVLAADNPKLVMTSLTSFGQDGPWRDYLGTDMVHLAGGGQMAACGYDAIDDPEQRPIAPGGGNGWHMGSHYAYIATTAALFHARMTGEGQHLDVSAHEAAALTTEMHVPTWIYTHQVVQRQTGRHAGVIPSQPVQVLAGDGRYVTTGFAPRRPGQIRTLLDWLDEIGIREEFESWPLLELGANLDHDITMAGIQEGGEDAMIYGAVRDSLVFIAEHITAYEFFVGTQSRDMQCGLIYSPDEVVEDRHFLERGWPTPVEHPELGETFIYPGAPYRMPASPWQIYRRAPLLGEHTTEVLAEIGMAEQEQSLRAAGVIA